jgi:hypothetical protein
MKGFVGAMLGGTQAENSTSIVAAMAAMSRRK